MSILDIIVLIILVIAVVSGYKRGLALEVLGISSIFIAAYVSYYSTRIASDWITTSFSYKDELVFILIFILVMLVVVKFAKLLSTLFNTIGLGILNNIGGSVISAIKSIILMSIALSLFMSLNRKMDFVSQESLYKSVTYKPMSKITEFMFPYFTKAKKGLKDIHEEYFN